MAAASAADSNNRGRTLRLRPNPAVGKRDKPAGIDLRLQVSKRQLHETRTVDRRADANARLIGNQGAVDLHLDQSSVPDEAPRNQGARPGTDAYAGVVGQLLRGFGRSASFDMDGRRGHP